MATRVKRRNDQGFQRMLKNLKYIRGHKIIVGFHGDEEAEKNYIVPNRFTGRPTILSKKGDSLVDRYVHNKDRWPTIETVVKNAGKSVFVPRILDNLDKPGVEKNMGMFAQSLRGLAQKEMNDVSSPPNSASTIARKGDSNPTVASGQTKAETKGWVSKK